MLRPQKKPNLTYKLISQSPLVKLEPYFGKTAQFPLANTLQVKKGDVIALTVPSWAPALALGFANTTSWRASRPKSELLEHLHPDGAHAGRHQRPVLLPVSHRAPDLQRDADLHTLSADAAARRRLRTQHRAAQRPSGGARFFGSAWRASLFARRFRRPMCRRRAVAGRRIRAVRLSPLGLLPPVDSELDSLSLALDSLSLLVFVLAVVEVAVVCAASFSALVFVGGVISGVLLGVASETLLEPPHAPSRRRTPAPARQPRPSARVVRGGCGAAGVGGCAHALTPRPGAPSGPMRRPHVGQSFRSFCAS